MISIKINNKVIEFRCSFKLLPLSLKTISLSFNLEPKLVFPYRFSQKKTLLYVGIKPDLKYFNSLIDYNCFLDFTKKNKVFSFKYYLLCI